MKKCKFIGMIAIVLCGLIFLACDESVAGGTVIDPNTVAEQSSSSTAIAIDVTSSEDSTKKWIFSDPAKVDVNEDSSCAFSRDSSMKEMNVTIEEILVEISEVRDSLLVAYYRANGSEMCDLPDVPTLFSTNLFALHRLMPVVEKRLTQRGNTDQCNYYLIAWKHEVDSFAYSLKSVTSDSIVISKANLSAAMRNTDVSSGEYVQEFLVVETCGDSLDSSVPVVVKQVSYAESVVPMLNDSTDTWFRADLLAARETCLAECAVQTEESVERDSLSVLYPKNSEEWCSSRCDNVYMEMARYGCHYDINEPVLSITCGADVCNAQRSQE